MPVLSVGGDADGLAGLEFLWLLSLDLVVAAAADRDEHLRRIVVDVPVVAATRLEGHVMDGDLRGLKYRRKVALPHEVLCETVIRLPHRKCARIFHFDPSFHICSVTFSIQRPAKTNVQCEYDISFHALIACQTIRVRHWHRQEEQGMLTFRTPTAKELQHD